MQKNSIAHVRFRLKADGQGEEMTGGHLPDYNNAITKEILAMARNEGMTTMKQDGIEKILKGHTDIKQIR